MEHNQAASVFSLLPVDILLEIAHILDFVSLSRLLCSCKRLLKIRDRTKINYLPPDFGKSLPKKSINWGLWKACNDNNRTLMDFFMAQGANDWNLALTGASTRELVYYFIRKGANDMESALLSAVKRNKKDFINIFIKKGARNWNECLWVATMQGNNNMAIFFAEKGATNIMQAALLAIVNRQNNLWWWSSRFSSRMDWNAAFRQALWCRNNSVMDYCIHVGKISDWKGALNIVTFQRRKDLVQTFAPKVTQLDSALAIAARKADMEIIHYFISLGCVNWNAGLIGAVAGGDMNVIQYFVDKGANDWVGAKQEAVKWHNRELEEYFHEKEISKPQSITRENEENNSKCDELESVAGVAITARLRRTCAHKKSRRSRGRF